MALVDTAVTTSSVEARIAGSRRDVTGPLFRALLLFGTTALDFYLAARIARAATPQSRRGWLVASVQLPSAPVVQLDDAVPLQVVPVGVPV